MNAPIRKQFTLSLKAHFPFRMGTTSYIVPDNILPNLRYLADRVDDVELVLFESEEFSNMPSPLEVEEMAALARDHRLTYTVHLPLDTRLGSADEAERRVSVRKCLHTIERMLPLDPWAFILHLHGDRRGDPPTDDPDRWMARNRESVQDLLRNSVPPHKICVENLEYDFDLVADIVNAYDLSVCTDVGHLILTHRDLETHLDKWFDRTRVFHLHGVRGGTRDHVSLDHLPDGILETLWKHLERETSPIERVMTLEVFSVNDFERSVSVLLEARFP